MSNIIATDCYVASGGAVQGYGQQHILTTSTGRIYSGHINSSDYLEIYYSDDGGTTWVLDTTLGDVVESYAFSMCKSDLDDIYVCYWQSSSPGNQTKYIYVKKRDHTAGTWSTVLTQVCGCQVATDRLEAMITYNRYIHRLHLVAVMHSYGSGRLGVFGNYSDDRGATWIWNANFSTASVAPAAIYIYDTFGGSSPYPCYMWGVDTNASTGQMYILWATTYSAQYFLTRCNSDHSSGTSYANLNSDTSGFQGGGVVIDSAGNVYTLINRLNSGSYYTYVYKNGLSTASLSINWGSTQIVSPGHVTIGIDSSDHIYVFYTKVADGVCYFRYFNGTSWGSEAALNSGTRGLRVSCEQHAKPTSTFVQVNFVSNV